jgi:hypothetical protein
MTLKELLEARNVRTALIVDDACDPVPTAADMRTAIGEWVNFNDDIEDEHRALIESIYPESAGMGFDDLIADDRYVAAVWTVRDKLGELTDPLFEIYDANQAADVRFVTVAREKFDALGLICETKGRAFAEEEVAADLVLIDLYFGGGQDDAALQESKKLLAKAIAPRSANPPLVILMSRSERLNAKRDEFRDDVGLVDSGFRIIRKADLETAILDRQLERLAQNAVETRRLAKLLSALENGITDAASRTISQMRKLKLSDIGQIQQLLLDVEGEPTGSYLVDVFDRVFQNEIEAQEGIIDAAIEMNNFISAEHPPPFVAGSTDLQELVARMLTQNERRLGLPGAVGALVTFGDLICRGGASQNGQPPALPVDLPLDGILLVLTPACDLQRGGAPRILLLVGTVKKLTAKDWSYGDDARTPAVRIDDELHWIKWNLKHVDTVSWDELQEALANKSVKVVARLRDAHALEIQQRVLSGLGRVGLVAAMPATFPVDVEAYVAGMDGKPARLHVPALTDGAVCFVGRDSNGGQILRLVMTEGECDGIVDALAALRVEDIAEKARTAFSHVQSTADLRHLLTTGLSLKNATTNGWWHIPSETGAASGVPKMGLLAWNYAIPDEVLAKGDLSKAGIILLVKDPNAPGFPGLGDAIRSGLVEQASETPKET